jgi:hypothetical protein
MSTFCTDEQVGDYAAAYGLLSKRAQAHLTRDAFVQMSQRVEIMECRPYHGVPLILAEQTAQLDVRYQYGSGHTFGTMSFVREQDGWRIDSMNPDFFQLSS